MTKKTPDKEASNDLALVQVTEIVHPHENETGLALVKSGLPPVLGDLESLFHLLLMDTAADKLCEAYLHKKIDVGSINAHRELSSKFMNEQERGAIDQALEAKGFTREKSDTFKTSLVRGAPSKFQQYLGSIAHAHTEMEAVIHLLDLCQGEKLREAFQMVHPMVNGVEDSGLREEVLGITGDLIQVVMDRPGDLTEYVKVGLRWLSDLVKKNRDEEGFVKVVKDAVLFQLNPDNIRTGGLTLSEIEKICRRINRRLDASEAKRVAIYDVVRHLLKAERHSSTLHKTLAKHKLEHYARVHARLMELRMDLRSLSSL